MNKCVYEVAWVGNCGKPTVSEDLKYCDEHSSKKCAECGEQATRECNETYQFVCGRPLCKSCVCICRTK